MSVIGSLMLLWLCCLLMSLKLVGLERFSTDPAPFAPVDEDIATTLNRIEKPICVTVYPLENYEGNPTCLRAGQYLEPLQIKQILEFKSIRVPSGVLFQISGDNAVSSSINSESSIPIWTPPPWVVTEVLIVESRLIGEKSHEDVSGRLEPASEGVTPGPNDVMMRLSDEFSNFVFALPQEIVA